MELIIARDGSARCLYDEVINLVQLGKLSIQRVSRVEPNDHGDWFADLSPLQGPVLGPFNCRSAALHAERVWLIENWLLPS